ncbi:MAG: hypothetical protein ACKVJG_07955 [Candidatus Latescibacterota bacterium]|jgi:hypothetical protein|tara:strand:+ start:329 stop:739 length:411 start_codon:yes stop_codon:yes gene_type:complete
MCHSSPPTFEKEFEVTGLDLSKYATEDFLITPNAYGSDYVTLAYIAVDGRNGAIWLGWDLDGSQSHITEWKQEEVNLQEVIEAAVKAAKDMGANGLVNVQWHSDTDIISPPGASSWSQLDRKKIYLEGWAIKRLGD